MTSPLTPALSPTQAEGKGESPRTRNFRHFLRGWIPLAVVILVLPFTLRALSGRLDIGGDHGQHTGIDQLAAAINALPANTVIYDYSLDWELVYYLGDRSSVRLVFEPSPQALARTVCDQGGYSYFAASLAESVPWLEPLHLRGGYMYIDTLFDGPFLLYRLSCSF
jgi:hypothetical protein